MRRQAALGIRVAAVFLLIVVGLPLASWLAPDALQFTVLGFPFSWFLLGLFFYPLTWALSSWFVQSSEALERQQAEEVRRGSATP